MIDAIKSFWSGLVGWLGDFFQWIADLPNKLVEWIWNAVLWIWFSAIERSLEVFKEFVSLAASWFGWNYSFNTQMLGDFYGSINVVLPLDEAVGLIKFLILTWWLVIVYRVFGIIAFRWIIGYFKQHLLKGKPL